jgi:putative transposase
MEKRGFRIDPQTINNLIHEYSSSAYKRFKETYNQRKGGWRVVQIPFKVQGRKKYLYRALNAQGNTLDFMISGSRSIEKAKKFFTKSLSSDLKVDNHYVDKRKNIKRKIPLKLIFGIITGLLVSLFTGIYLVNLLEKKPPKNNSQAYYNQPNLCLT